MPLTATQQQALTARGNVLLVAGAGTGKTRTLVERCLHCLLRQDPVASINELLMVTFTDAAAAEMRQRIRERLEEELKTNPNDAHCQEQLALFDTAHIGTLHSFCLQLVRQHFYALEIDPQVSVLREEEAQLLASEQLDRLLQQYYAGKYDKAMAVRELVHNYGSGSDEPIRSLVLRLHHYSQTLADPAEWFERQIQHFAAAEAVQWREWLTEGMASWRETWLPALKSSPVNNTVAQQCRAVVQNMSAGATGAQTATVLKQVLEICGNCPHGKKVEWLEPLKDFREETEFLASLTSEGTTDPLTEDWNWVRTPMKTLLEVAMDFGAAFGEAKRDLGMLDFHDLEQLALRLLWDHRRARPTEVAEEWRQTFRHVFVDEYQDINEA